MNGIMGSYFLYSFFMAERESQPGEPRVLHGNELVYHALWRREIDDLDKKLESFPAGDPARESLEAQKASIAEKLRESIFDISSRAEKVDAERLDNYQLVSLIDEFHLVHGFGELSLELKRVFSLRMREFFQRFGLKVLAIAYSQHAHRTQCHFTFEKRAAEQVQAARFFNHSQFDADVHGQPDISVGWLFMDQVRELMDNKAFLPSPPNPRVRGITVKVGEEVSRTLSDEEVRQGRRDHGIVG